ncbi:hypothetical protein D3C77_669840 [compost metagenome]
MPSIDCGVIGPLAMRSAPWVSLVRTLPVRIRWASVAVTVLVSATAVGASSTMLISTDAVSESPSLSIATTSRLSTRLLPLGGRCA